MSISRAKWLFKHTTYIDIRFALRNKNTGHSGAEQRMLPPGSLALLLEQVLHHDTHITSCPSFVRHNNNRRALYSVLLFILFRLTTCVCPSVRTELNHLPESREACVLYTRTVIPSTDTIHESLMRRKHRGK